jgi:toxin CcdB
MARFDVHSNPEGPGWLVDLQTDLLDGFNTRVVAPLLPPDRAPKPAQRLNPVFEIDGQPAVLVTQYLAAVPAAMLGVPIGSLRAEQDRMTAAVDMLPQGL